MTLSATDSTPKCHNQQTSLIRWTVKDIHLLRTRSSFVVCAHISANNVLSTISAQSYLATHSVYGVFFDSVGMSRDLHLCTQGADEQTPVEHYVSFCADTVQDRDEQHTISDYGDLTAPNSFAISTHETTHPRRRRKSCAGPLVSVSGLVDVSS